MKCEACGGLGYREYEGGVLRLRCRPCNGTGEVVYRRELKDCDESPPVIEGTVVRVDDQYSLGNWETSPTTAEVIKSQELSPEMERTISEAALELKERMTNDDNDGAGQLNKAGGSTDTSKPKRTTRRKVKPKARKATAKILPKS